MVTEVSTLWIIAVAVEIGDLPISVLMLGGAGELLMRMRILHVKLIAFWYEWEVLKYRSRSLNLVYFVDYRDAACGTRNRPGV